VLGVVVVVAFAAVTIGALAVQHRQNIAQQGLAGFLMEDDTTPYVAAGASQASTITQIVVQQQDVARKVRVAWPVSDADLLQKQDFTVYAIKQEKYDSQMSTDLIGVYGADLVNRFSDTQKAAFYKERGWEGAFHETTIVTARNSQQMAPQKGLAVYDFPLITEPGSYRFRVCAEWVDVQLATNNPPGACSPELVYTMDKLEGS